MLRYWRLGVLVLLAPTPMLGTGCDCTRCEVIQAECDTRCLFQGGVVKNTCLEDTNGCAASGHCECETGGIWTP